jgi:hypothetical protein
VEVGAERAGFASRRRFMSTFAPTHCPNPGCADHLGGLRFQRDGSFLRRCDGRRVPRFRCGRCARRFSLQSFRLDWRQRKPHVNVALFGCLISKVTHRQAARVLRIDRKTVHRRLRLWGPALRRFHAAQLVRARRRGGLSGFFSFDELETFENDRRLQPLTVPVLIHRKTRFLVHLEVAPLPARGGLSPRDRERKERRAAAFGRRVSGSAAAVERCLLALKDVHAPLAPVELITDRKRSYPPLVRRMFPHRAAFVRESSGAVRNTLNPLFAINHTLAMLRDQVSRLVRRNWGASKRADQLVHHLWIFAAWRNYVRPTFNHTPSQSAASALGLFPGRLKPADLLRWKWPERRSALTN